MPGGKGSKGTDLHKGSVLDTSVIDRLWERYDVRKTGSIPRDDALRFIEELATQLKVWHCGTACGSDAHGKQVEYLKDNAEKVLATCMLAPTSGGELSLAKSSFKVIVGIIAGDGATVAASQGSCKKIEQHCAHDVML